MKAARDMIEKQFRLLDNFYLEIIRQHEKKMQADLRDFETFISRSWKWRIGAGVVNFSLRILNFLKNPAMFFREGAYRNSWQGIPLNTFPHFQYMPVSGSELILKKPQLVLPAEAEVETVPRESTVQEQHPSPFPRRIPETIVVILDAANTSLLSSQGQVFPLKPDNIAEQMTQAEPGIFLCESASRGNGGAWQYRLTGEDGEVTAEIREVISECKSRSVPAFFWMTSHAAFSAVFYQTASLFDFILSPFKGAAGNFPVHLTDRVHYFPYTIDPKIHHPFSSGARIPKALFLFSSDGPTELLQSSRLIDFLTPAADHGLDAYDEASGKSPFQPGTFALPGVLVMGYLPYVKMAEQFRRYSALLNFTLQGNDQNCIPKWIFEALACGMPVISERNELLEETFGDAILFAETGRDVAEYLERIQNEPLFRMRQVVKGVRAVMKSHQIASRINEIKLLAGLRATESADPLVCLLIDAGEEQGLDGLIRCILRQTKSPNKVALFTHNPLPEASLEKFRSELSGILVNSFIYYHHQLYQPVRESMGCDFYMVWQRGCLYGDHYIEDYLSAVSFSDINVFCKRSFFVAADGRSTLVDPDSIFCKVASAPVSTVMMDSEALAGFHFLQMTDPEAVYDAFDERMISLDPLNYLRSIDQSRGEDIPLWNELNI